MKKSLFLLIIFFCFVGVKGQNLSEQLITIHRVANQTAMNTIANPENLSLVYLDSEQITYQYINGVWVPL